MQRLLSASLRRLGSSVLIGGFSVRMNSTSSAEGRLASMTTDELMTKAMSYSKQFIPQDQRHGVQLLLLEVLHRRAAVLTVKGFRDILALAHLSENYGLCVEIFRRRFKTHSTDPKFTVYDTVVESAYKASDLEALEEIAAVCSRRLRAAPREVISDFALCRSLWRCMCLNTDPESTAEVKVAALGAADRIWSNSIVTIVPDVEQRTSLKEVSKEARRQMLYASPDEKGEMAFFLMCKQKGILRTSTRPLHELRNNETYYCALIRTCRNGCFADVAMDYFEELRSASTATMLKRVAGSEDGVAVGDADASSSDADSAFDGASEAERALFETLGVESGSRRTNLFAENGLGSSSGVDPEGGAAGLTEVVIFAVVAVLHAAKDNQRIVDMGKTLLADPTNSLSASILATLGTAGGEVKDINFVHSCYEGIVKAQRAAQNPNTFLVYSALSAVSKCHVKEFKETYLDPCLEQRLINNDPETHTYLILQNAMGSVNPMEVAGPMVASALGDGNFAQSLSVRVASLLFKVLLRGESPDFLPLYKQIVRECGLFRQVWVEELILWADRRRYFLSQDDRQFIMSEIKRHYRITDIKSANLHGLEKLRTHVAAIQHDLQFNSLNRFRKERWISPEPTVLDSRIHFILKKRTCVEGNPQEQLKRFVQDHPGVRKQHLALAQTALSSALASPQEVTQDEFRYGLVDLLSSKQMETL